MFQPLRKNISGEVFTSPEELQKFSHDESILEIVPKAVVLPKTEDDLKAVIEFAKEHSIPITARGGGTSLAGQSIGSGLVIDFSKYMNQVLDIGETSVTVQPGIILDTLNEALAPFGKRIAPDPASRAWCTVGGMVGNNASGPHALKYGDTRKNTVRLKTQTLVPNPDLSNLKTRILAQKSMIESQLPKTTKNSCGYNLSSFFDSEVDLTKLIVGSEGTLALVSEVELKTIPLPEKTTTVLYFFDSVKEAALFGLKLRSFQPQAIELMNHWILSALHGLDLPKAKASLWVEWEGDAPEECLENGKVLTDSNEQKHLWRVRSTASKVLQEIPGPRKAVRCIEDGCVPLEHLGDYIEHLEEIMKKYDCDGAMFGHVGDAHLHVNPRIDLSRNDVLPLIEKLMEEVYTFILKRHGTITGEHGDGILRRSWSRKQWGETFALFEEIRNTFDPNRLLNPQVKTTQNEVSMSQLLQTVGRPPYCLMKR